MAQDPQEARGGQESAESAGKNLARKLFVNKGNGEEADNDARSSREGVARIPATVLTVEYVDDSEGMDAALRNMNERLRTVEERVGAMQETQRQLVAAVNRQAEDTGRVVESIGRRIALFTRLADEFTLDAFPETSNSQFADSVFASNRQPRPEHVVLNSPETGGSFVQPVLR